MHDTGGHTARSDYIYVIKAGSRRENILGCYTVKHEMRRDLMRLLKDRQDMTVVRHHDGEPSTGAVMRTADIVANKRGGEE